MIDQGTEVGGGDQFVSSFWKIYQELANIAPEVLETLAAETWPWRLQIRKCFFDSSFIDFFVDSFLLLE